MTQNQSESPFVSVIVPVYNAPEDIRNCLGSLVEQTYPDKRWELLVVDNDSTDRTPEVVKEYDEAKLLRELEIQGSYAARNKGMKNADGEIIAFIDSDCTPEPDWLEQGVKGLSCKSADLGGGKVRFTYSSTHSAAEMYDSMVNMQIEQNIKERSVAKTANLFVRKEVFEAIGMFPSGVKSGGDVAWTKKATDEGHQLIYLESAIVSHPARSFRPLLRKQCRVGKGKYDSGTNSGIQYFLRQLLPPKPTTFRATLNEKLSAEHLSRKSVVEIYFVGWVCKIATATGWLFSNIRS